MSTNVFEITYLVLSWFQGLVQILARWLAQYGITEGEALSVAWAYLSVFVAWLALRYVIFPTRTCARAIFMEVIWFLTTPVRMIHNVWMLMRDKVDFGMTTLAYVSIWSVSISLQASCHFANCSLD